MSQASDEAKIKQALIQNTLEQAAIAIPTYLAWAAIMPHENHSAIPFCASLFLIGRVIFFAGYRYGAPGRAFGFGLTFMPTMVLMGIMAFTTVKALF